MFWIGVVISLGGLLGIPLWRHWIQSRLHLATDRALDILRSLLIFLGIVVSLVSYLQSGHENETLQRSLQTTQDSQRKAEEEITKVRRELTESQQKQAAAEQALRDVQAQQRARTLTAEQRRTLIEQLEAAPKGKVQVGFIAGDAEGERFAEQLWQVLKMAGWPVSPQMPQYAGLPRTPIGISLAMNRSGKAPHGEFLQHTLRNVGIDISITNEPVSGDLVHLTVGAKPQPRQ
jgi:hypothetical protein